MKKSLLLFGFMLLAGMALAANPCTVGPTGEVATIQAAITSWCAGGTNYGATPPFIVNIDPSVEYDEMITLDDARPTGNIRGALVLQSATPGTKVIVKLRYDTGTLPAQAAGSRDGLWVHQGAYDITFKDLLFMASPNGTVVDDDLVKCDENNNTTATIVNTFTFDGCIFTDGFTSGTARVPKITSKADIIAMNFPTDMSAFVPTGSMTANDDLLKFWGDTSPIMERMNLMVKDCVFFTRNARPFEAYAACTTETITIQDSLFATYNANTSYYPLVARPYNDDTYVNIIGTKDPRQGDLTKCTAVLCARQHPVYPSGGGAYPIGDATIKNVLVSVYNDTATAARPISGGAEGKLIEDSIFFVDRFPGNMVDYALTKNSIYNRCTFHSPTADGLTPQNLLYLGESADPYGVIMTDCVISGRRMPALNNASGLDVGGLHLWNCNIALAGPDAITSTGITATLHNCTFVDPMYLSYDRKQETFLDTGNPALAFMSSGGIGIGGGAHFRGIPDASQEVAGQPVNIMKDVGACETDLFRVASNRGNWGDPLDGYGPGTEGDIYTVQDQVQGIVGNADWVHHASGRLEAGSGTGTFPGAISYSPIVFKGLGPNPNTDGGTDVDWKFYYKIPTTFSSYPRIAIRIDPRHPPMTTAGWGEVGDCAHKIELWIKTSAPTYNPWTVDNNWHQKTVNLSTGVSQISQAGFVMESTDVPVHHDVNIFINNYLVPSWYIDEIYLTDASGPMSGVSDWGLF
jgi:hypothetical protein